MNLLHYLVLKYPDQRWNWTTLPTDESFPLSYVLENQDNGWYWPIIFARQDVTPEFLDQLSDGNKTQVTSRKYAAHTGMNWSFKECIISFRDNPNMTPEFIERHIDLSWDYETLSSNPNMTTDFIRKHIDEDWNWGSNGLSSNECITSDFIGEFIEKRWDFVVLSSKPVISELLVSTYLSKPWDWTALRVNPSISQQFVHEKHDAMCADILNFPRAPWFWGCLQIDEEVTCAFVEENINEPWDFGFLSQSKYLEPYLVEKFPDKPWNYMWLSGWERFARLVHKLPHKEWCWDLILKSGCVTFDFVDRYKQKDWNWVHVSRLPDFPVDRVDEFQHLNLDWWHLSVHVPFSFVKSHLWFSWSWDRMHMNETVAEEDIIELSDKNWSWTLMSGGLGTPAVCRSVFSVKQSSKKPLSKEFILRFISKRFCWIRLATNPNLDYAFLEQHAPLTYQIVRPFSTNVNMTPDFLDSFPWKTWSWPLLSDNLAITLDYIAARSYLNWDWVVVSARPDITLEFVEAHIHLPWISALVCKTIGPNLTLDFIELLAQYHADTFVVICPDEKVTFDLETYWKKQLFRKNPRFPVDVTNTIIRFI